MHSVSHNANNLNLEINSYSSIKTPKSSNSFYEAKVVEIDQKKIQKISTEKQIGIHKKITKFSVKNLNKETEVTQIYFSGLVYRLDSRDLNEITNSGGFYPKQNRELNHPLLATDVCKSLSLTTNNYLIINKVYTWNEKGIVATSKNFRTFNVDSTWKNKFKYVIDTSINENYGLDIDKTMQLPEKDKTYEVDFETPIKNECIVGCFKKRDHDNNFYPNDLYKGNFSWDAENIVFNYKSKILANDNYQYFGQFLTIKVVDIIH